MLDAMLKKEFRLRRNHNFICFNDCLYLLVSFNLQVSPRLLLTLYAITFIIMTTKLVR
jgi:hypothetical protein